MKETFGCIRSFRLNGCGPAATRTYSEWIARGLDFHHHRSHAFTGFISAFMIVKGRAVGGVWPPAGQPLLLAEETLLNTAALVVSGLALIVTEIVFRRNAKAAIIPFFCFPCTRRLVCGGSGH